jgi:hypothetical protein
VTFDTTVGTVTTPGLVVSSGVLQSPNITVNSNSSVSSASFMAHDLQFVYNSSATGSNFTLFGSLGVSIQSIVGLSVTAELCPP